MTFEELKKKALSLPLVPGVYLMQDKSGQVIYVGKAKKLKNRVSQYFQDSAAHSPKTRRMVAQIFQFDTITAGSEFEALVLECSLIKRHMPRYNILLKDDKGYPYIRIDTSKPYPVPELVGRVGQDDALYFGPYGGRFVTQQVIDAIRLALKLPGCTRQFPRDIGKGRPCLNHHIGNCEGWCRSADMQQEYQHRIQQAIRLLKGDHKAVTDEIRARMETAAEELRFEEAAALRDRLRAVENLKQKQYVISGSTELTDVIGYYENESKACFAVLHFIGGDLVDKDYEILPPAEGDSEAIAALMKQYYLARGAAPKEILLPVDVEDAELFSQLLQETYGRKTRIRVPQRGSGVRLLELAQANAREETERITTKEEKHRGTLLALGKLMGLDGAPNRLESFDISNTGGQDIVASMVVYVDGKPAKGEYRRFMINGLSDQDDYASMRQVIRRRFQRYLDQDEKFSQLPDALLIDGGAVHAACAAEVLAELGITVPIFGMVKDGRHRTRGLVLPSGEELGLTANPALFAFVGRIQEETHRFAVTYHHNLHSRRVRTSALEQIEGVGEVRRKLLLKEFGTVKAVRQASREDLCRVVPQNVANAVYSHFHPEEEQV